jgi:hypothetical protein
MPRSLPSAKTILASYENKDTLVRYIALQAREMNYVLHDCYACETLIGQLPHPLERNHTMVEDVIERGARALRDIAVIRLAKMFDKESNLGFKAIIAEYNRGSVDKALLKKMNEEVKQFRQNREWVFEYRHTVVAHTDRQRKTNEFHSADISNELLSEAINVMDLFVDGEIKYSMHEIDLRKHFGNES